MAAYYPPDGLCCCRRRRPVRQPVGEVCLPQLNVFGLVVLHPVWVVPRWWISVSRRRSSSSSSPVWTSPMVFHRIHVRRSELRHTVSCGTSMGWGLLVGWEQVFSLCFRRSLLLASNGGGRIQSCRRRRRRRRTGDSSCGPGCNLLLLQAALCKFWDVILLIYKPTRFAKKDPCRSNWLQELYIF